MLDLERLGNDILLACPEARVTWDAERASFGLWVGKQLVTVVFRNGFGSIRLYPEVRTAITSLLIGITLQMGEENTNGSTK